MKTFPHVHFSIAVSVMLLAASLIPQKNFAQRFNHANFSGGGNARAAMPVSRPAPSIHSAPSERPAPRQEVQAPVPNRVTINGGSQNIGNHDFNHNANAVIHQNATVHDNVAVHENVNPREPVRDNEHLYHTNYNRGLNPYTYHPYHPYVWGPRWHPSGFFLAALTANAVRLSIGSQWYYYADGCYYVPYGAGYTVVPPPIGAVVSYLPDGYETVLVGNDTYYYYGGAFYVSTDQGYQVVQPPYGAVISQLPVGAIEQNINGETLLVYNNTYYQPISQNGQDAYQVVPAN